MLSLAHQKVNNNLRTGRSYPVGADSGSRNNCEWSCFFYTLVDGQVDHKFDRLNYPMKATRPTKTTQSRALACSRIAAGLLSTLLLLPLGSTADELDDAYRLLRITEVAREFEQATHQQTRNVIRTYDSIVAMSTDRELPDSIKQQISACYLETYAWEKFEPGIAAIFADNLSRAELKLMIDFFSDKSVPPPKIEQFKALIARADAIEQMAIDYMFSQTEGCDEQNVRLILNFLAGQGS
jgi:hypothetical protein